MKRNGGLRLPVFTNSESKLVKGSFDFIGVLYYSCATIIDNPESLRLQQRDFGADMAATINYFVDPVSSTSIFPIAPWGLRSFLEYIKEAYGNPPIYIYENGQRMLQNSSLDDIPRVNYLNGFIGGLLEALRNGSNTRGYFVWSFLDVLELFDGNEVSFGLYYVNLDDPDLKRYPKLSAISYSNFLKGKTFSSDAVSEVTKPSSLSYSLL